MSRPRTATTVLETLGSFDHDPNRRRENEPVPPDGAPVKPKLKGRASRIWDEYAAICIGMGTLKRGDEPEFATWCNLQAEYEKSPTKFVTARLAQKRTYAERFGIAGSGSRAKLAVTRKEKDADPADKYFDLHNFGPDDSVRQ